MSLFLCVDMNNDSIYKNVESSGWNRSLDIEHVKIIRLNSDYHI